MNLQDVVSEAIEQLEAQFDSDLGVEAQKVLRDHCELAAITAFQASERHGFPLRVSFWDGLWLTYDPRQEAAADGVEIVSLAARAKRERELYEKALRKIQECLDSDTPGIVIEAVNQTRKYLYLRRELGWEEV